MPAKTKGKPLPKYEVLFPFIEYFEKCPKQEWSGGSNKDGVLTWPYCNFSEELSQFLEVFYESDLPDTNYMGTLELYGVEGGKCAEAIPSANVELLLAILTFYIRGDRFCEGLLDSAIQKGIIADILKRLQELHLSRRTPGTVENK